MFFVMLERKNGWQKTMFGAKRIKEPPYNYGGITSENFEGMGTFAEGVVALREACLRHPYCKYRLVHRS